jgi:transcriptional regulator with XRE-family HTH domain
MARKNQTQSGYRERTLSQQVLIWRRHVGLTQGELERQAGLAHNAISRIENGEVSPKLETIEKVAAAMSISVEQLQFKQPSIRIQEDDPGYGRRSIDQEIENLPEAMRERTKALISELIKLLKEW